MRRLPLGEFAVAVAFFVAAFAAARLSHVNEALDTVWPGNALAAALLVRLPHVRWAAALLAISVAGICANWLGVHEPLAYSVGMSVVNTLEIGMTAWVFRNWLTFPLPNISFQQGLRMAGVFAFAVPVLTALPGGLLVHSEFGVPLFEASVNWWLAGAMGSCLCAPAVYLYSAKTARRLISKPFLAENLTLTAFCLVGSFLSVRYVHHPLVIVALTLTVSAFRMGSFGAAVLSGVCGALIIGLWSFGLRPSLLDGSPLPLPFLALVATILPPVAVGLATDERRTATRELAAERQRLRTTLGAIADAVITTDAQCQITYLNTAAQQLIGQSLNDIQGRKFYDVVVVTDPRTSRVAQSTLVRCIESGEIVRPDEIGLLHRPDGDLRYVARVATPVFGQARKVVGAVLVLRDATETYERDRRLSHLATHDVLTGACNRFEFERRLQVLFDRARLLILPATLVAVDLDRFKAVNDLGGHAAGDAVLRCVVAVLRENIRPQDTVARLGGDEFAVVLEKVTPERARAVALQIQQALNPLEVEWNRTTYSIGASLGVAAITNGYESTADWMAAADAACYEAKRAQRGQIRFAPPTGPSAADPSSGERAAG